MTAVDDLIAFWKAAKGEYIHPKDQAIKDHAEFNVRLHPAPWVGPICTASTFILLLNPGLSEEDEPFEHNNPEFVQRLARNLEGHEPYVYLDETYKEHPGHRWAKRLFGPDIYEYKTEKICVLQLVPYHSKNGRTARSLATKLPSSEIMRQFVQTALSERVRKKEAALIVARSAKLWQVPDDIRQPNNDLVVTYSPSQARSAFQTKNTSGGRLLRRRLKL